MDSHLREYRHLPGKSFRGHGVGTGPGIRETGIGLDDHRKRGPLPDGPHHGYEILRAQRTVYAQCIHPQPVQCQGHGGRICTRKRSSVLFECHGYPDWKRSVFFCGKNGGFHFIQVRHGLKNDQIGTCFFPCSDDLPEAVIGIVKRQSPQRLHQFTDGTHIQRDPDSSGVPHTVRSLPRGPYISPDHIPDIIAGSLIFVGIDTEGIGIDHITSGLDIAKVDVSDDIRMVHAEHFGFFAHFEAGALQHGTHRTVQVDHPVSYFIHHS